MRAASSDGPLLVSIRITVTPGHPQFYHPSSRKDSNFLLPLRHPSPSSIHLVAVHRFFHSISLSSFFSPFSPSFSFSFFSLLFFSFFFLFQRLSRRDSICVSSWIIGISSMEEGREEEVGWLLASTPVSAPRESVDREREKKGERDWLTSARL